jgi:hypothetical protein
LVLEAAALVLGREELEANGSVGDGEAEGTVDGVADVILGAAGERGRRNLLLLVQHLDLNVGVEILNSREKGRWREPTVACPFITPLLESWAFSDLGPDFTSLTKIYLFFFFLKKKLFHRILGRQDQVNHVFNIVVDNWLEAVQGC